MVRPKTTWKAAGAKNDHKDPSDRRSGKEERREVHQSKRQRSRSRERHDDSQMGSKSGRMNDYEYRRQPTIANSRHSGSSNDGKQKRSNGNNPNDIPVQGNKLVRIRNENSRVYDDRPQTNLEQRSGKYQRNGRETGPNRSTLSSEAHEDSGIKPTLQKKIPTGPSSTRAHYNRHYENDKYRADTKEQDHKQSSNDDKHREKSTARDSISRKAAPGRELYGKRSGRSPRRERSPKRFKSEPRGPRNNVKEKEEENSQTTTFVQPKTEFIINSSPVKDLTRPNIIMRKSSIYERVLQVGEGTYGKVYKAKNVDTGHMAALKRLRMESERDGMPITAIREIKLLQSLRHHSIVSLREMIIEEGYIYMAFEYLDHDLAGILAHPTLTLGHGQVKYLFKQMMEGLSYLHHKNILHRDIKGSNILVDNEGNIKLADFGLARKVNLENKDAHYTNRVITLWYRPPELLLGATMYCGAIDVWGMGCLLVELFNRKAIFQGRDEIEQLSCIYDIMGTPTTEEWPSMLELPWYQMLLPSEPKPSRFMQEFSSVLVTGSAADLASKLLALNPNKRATSDEALAHAYFSEDPAPEKLDLKGIGEWHDFEAKKRRRKEREEKKRREVEEK